MLNLFEQRFFIDRISKYKIPNSYITLEFFDVPAAHSVNPASARITLIDAVRKWCGPPGSRKMPKRLYHSHRDVGIEVSCFASAFYERMTYDDACTVTRGMLEYMERFEKYRETVFGISIGSQLEGSGKLEFLRTDGE